MSGRRNILEIVNSIDVEDLFLIEKDLCFHEKVSLAFLLFADKKSNAQCILQVLLVVTRNPKEATDILINYTKINKEWKIFLVEALAIIQANKVLKKLGFSISEIRTHFLPHIPEVALHINPIVKALFSMCDMLTPIEAGKLVLDIRATSNIDGTKDHLPFYNFEYLEVFLLDWITKSVLDVSGTATTDISILINYLKLNEINQIKEMLSNLVRFLNLETNDSERKDLLEIPTKNTNADKIKSVDTQRPPADVKLNDCYKIKPESAGFVLIINQRNFHRSTNPELQHLLPKKQLQERLGTDVDKNLLESTFSSFGYKPIGRDNLNHIELLQNIREVVKRSIMYDSLIVCVLTHGLEGSIYASDSIPIKIDQIEKILTGESLIRKPKMLIIQACQGDSLQRARVVECLENDSGENSAIDYGDMVKAMSTVPGFASLRNTQTGTWFIQTLCAKINELGDRDHMLEILTEVNDAVCEKRGYDNVCMTPISSQTLRKKFRLPSRQMNLIAYHNHIS